MEEFKYYIEKNYDKIPFDTACEIERLIQEYEEMQSKLWNESLMAEPFRCKNCSYLQIEYDDYIETYICKRDGYAVELLRKKESDVEELYPYTLLSCNKIDCDMPCDLLALIRNHKKERGEI